MEYGTNLVAGVTPGSFGAYLLYGVTGSGKTEVYLELAERTLAAGRRVLWLVPEIGLTPRLLSRLEARFPGRVAVGHAGLNASEKQADVLRLLQDAAPLFVGVRNAVLAPLRDIGLIVVDEEQEGSYKSEEHPRFHARDLAVKRAQLEGCPVVLGSATPSLESWQAAAAGRYRLLRLMDRPAGVELPSVKVVDLRECYKAERKKVIFSPLLLKAMGETLARGEQSMLLLNRRGSLEAGLLAAELGEVDILVGTQMLAKGHNFPMLTLVGILNADLGLKIPDFRAAERTFQLLTQVAGRAGRAGIPGRVLLQTYSPDHPAIVHAVAQNFEAFAAEELPYREALGYPPYSAMSLYRSEGDTPVAALEPLRALRSRLESLPGLRILGPLEAPVARVKDRYRMQLILKAAGRQLLGEAMRHAPLVPGGPVTLDRDPLQFGV